MYRAHYVALVRLAALLTGDAIVAEEVAIDSITALLTGPAGPGWPGSALPRLHRQVLIRSRRAVRAGYRADEGVRGHIGSPGWRSAPIIGLLASLSVSQREAVVLRHYLDLSDEDTAAAMGASLRAVRHSLETAGHALAALPGAHGRQPIR